MCNAFLKLLGFLGLPQKEKEETPPTQTPENNTENQPAFITL